MHLKPNKPRQMPNSPGWLSTPIEDSKRAMSMPSLDSSVDEYGDIDEIDPSDPSSSLDDYNSMKQKYSDIQKRASDEDQLAIQSRDKTSSSATSSINSETTFSSCCGRHLHVQTPPKIILNPDHYQFENIPPAASVCSKAGPERFTLMSPVVRSRSRLSVASLRDETNEESTSEYKSPHQRRHSFQLRPKTSLEVPEITVTPSSGQNRCSDVYEEDERSEYEPMTANNTTDKQNCDIEMEELVKRVDSPSALSSSEDLNQSQFSINDCSIM